MTTRRCSRFEFSYRCSPFDFFVRVIAAVTGSYLLLYAFGITIPTILLSSLILFISLQPYAFVSFDKFDKAVHQAFNIFSIIFCISATFFLLTFSYRHYFSIPPASTAKNPCIQQPHSATTTPTKSKEYSQNNCPPLERSIATEPTDAIDKIGNDALLAILSLVIAFAGFMSYVFLKVVKANLHQELLNAAHDERVASRVDISKSVSSLHTELYDFATKIPINQNNKTEIVEHEKYLLSLLDRAIKEDRNGLKIFEKMKNEQEHQGLKLKVWNNYAYDIYLKCKHEKKFPSEKEQIILLEVQCMLRKHLFASSHKPNCGYEDIQEEDREQLEDTYIRVNDILSKKNYGNS